MAKKLMINCSTCDARNALEENYAHYEQIIINCALVLTSPQAKAMMNKLPFVLNCSDVLEVEGDMTRAFRYGVAAGAASVMTEGTQLIRLDDFEMLLKQVRVQEV